MNETLISVVFLAHDKPEYIPECLESIMAQTYENLDIICIYDDSCDVVFDALRRYQERDERISIHKCPDRQKSAAKNFGISIAKGEYILFLESPDRLRPDAVQGLLGKSLEDNLDILLFEYRLFFDCSNIGSVWEKRRHETFRSREYSEIRTGEELFSLLMKNWDYRYEMQPALYHADFLRSTKIQFYEDIIEQNFLFSFMTLFQARRVSHLKYPYYEKRVDVNAVNSNEEFPSLSLFISSFICCREILSVALTVNLESKAMQWLYKLIEEFSIKSHYYYNQLSQEEIDSLGWDENPLSHILYRCGAYENAWKTAEALRNNEKSFSFRIGRILTFPIRKIKGFVLSEKTEFFKKIFRKKAILLQTPLHYNIGDHAIAISEMRLLDALNISTLDYPYSTDIENQLASVTPRNKTILITGGGWLGSLYKNEEYRFRAALKYFRKNKIIVFPQTVYFDMQTPEDILFFEESKQAYESHHDLTIFVREIVSYDFMRKNMPSVNVKLVPDIVMTYKPDFTTENRSGCLICLREDKEKLFSEENSRKLKSMLDQYFNHVKITDMIADDPIDLAHRNQAVHDKLKEFSSAEMVITDRLHGMIFAAITETPCIVLDSKSYKLRGCYEWLKCLDYIRFADDMDELCSAIKELRLVDPKYDWNFIDNAMKQLYDELQSIK